MKQPKPPILPVARRSDLLTRKIPGELLVYDLKRHKAFCLNETAATIWKGCNGKRTVADLAALLDDEERRPLDEKIVWLALDQLERTHLLQTTSMGGAIVPMISRRSLIRSSIAAAIALPVVTMIAAPTAQAAGTAVTAAVCRARNPPNCGDVPCSDRTNAVCSAVGPNNCFCR
jgi:hypothetical protein